MVKENLLEETGQRINGHHFIITKAHLEIKKIEDPNHMHISDQQKDFDTTNLFSVFLRLAKKLKICLLRVYI